MKHGLLASTLALAMMCLPAAGALAQTANLLDQAVSGVSAGGTAAATDQLQEVVVTAERRSVDVQATPIAITAVSGDQLLTQHVSAIGDLQTIVPGLQSTSSGTSYGTEFNIRGMGTALVNPGVEPGVTQIRDGLAFGDSAGAMEPLYDVADTEVLKGPQGTLVGASSVAGAVEINTANPMLGGGVTGYVLGGVATYTDMHYQGAINLPVTDTFAARLAFDHENRNSFYYDVGTSQRGFYYANYSQTNPASDGPPLPLNQGLLGPTGPARDSGNVDGDAVRLSLLWKPTDNFQALNKFSFYRDKSDGGTNEPITAPYTSLFTASPNTLGFNGMPNPFLPPTGCFSQPASQNFAGASGLQLLCGQGAVNRGVPGAGLGQITRSTYYYPGEQPYQLDYYGLQSYFDQHEQHESLELRYTLPDGVVVRSLSGDSLVITPQAYSQSNGPQNAGEANEYGRLAEYSEEINFISPTTGPFFGKLNWIAGAWWRYRDSELPTASTSVSPPYQPNTLPSIVNYYPFNGVQRNGAVFGQINWQMTHTLQLQVGARLNGDAPFNNNLAAPAPTNPPVLPQPNGGGLYLVDYNPLSPVPTWPPLGYSVLNPWNLASHYSHCCVPTGKVDLNWTPVQGQNFYVFWARGYKAGTNNQGSVDHPIANPETIDDFELGWKGRLLDGHVFTQVDAYYDFYHDMLYGLFDATGNNDMPGSLFGGFTGYTANLPTSRLYGLEIAAQSRFGGLGVNVNLSYNHSALGAVTTVPGYALPNFGLGATVPQCLPNGNYPASVVPGLPLPIPNYCFDYRPYQVSLSGEALPFSPLFTGSVSVDYQFHVGQGVIDPRVSFQHTDSQYSQIFQTLYSYMGPRNLLNASVDWIVGQWDTQLWGNNLTNLVYIVGNDNYANITYGSPRQYGLQVTRHF